MMRRPVPIVKLKRVFAAIGCGCACFIGCASDPPETVARSSSAITQGSPDSGDEAVAAIVAASGVTACSGTLIAPHLLLTAGHCAAPEVIQGGTVVLGASLTDGVAIPIAKAVIHPQFDPASLTNDVAILVLGSAATAAPVPPGTDAPEVGATVRIVGWGLTAQDAGDTGLKRQGAAAVTAVDVLTFGVASVPSQPCEGDSGGPALAMANGVESVVGITSHGDVACVQGATYTRVDALLASFIQPTMTQFAAGSAGAGEVCLFPEQCAGGAVACVVAPDDASLSYCTVACRENADCPAAMACVDIVGAGSQCRYPVPTPGAYGAGCTGSPDCLEGECTTTGICALRCVPDGATCPAGFECTNTSGIDFFCIGTPPPTVEGAGCALAPTGRPVSLLWVMPVALTLRLARRRARRR